MLNTKLRTPRLPSDYVSRPRLHERLTAGNGRRLTLVSAPAGCGNTLALAGWLQHVDRPHVWISLDEFDDDLTSFAMVLASALESVIPGAGRQAQTALARSRHPSPGELSAHLANDLNSIDRDLIVVMDDYHVIREPSVHMMMSLLLKQLPPNVQLVLSSREEPPLRVAALRARGDLAEIHADDLRFSCSEAGALLADLGRPPLEPQIVADAVDRTEGWAVGLRMLALQGKLTLPNGAHEQSASPQQRPFADAYLLDEVLSRQTPELKRFLIQTSVLDRFCVPLVGTIMDGLQPGEAQRLIDATMTAGLFLVALDDQQRWYRYHVLFRDMLRRCLEREFGTEHARALITRASVWLEANGLHEEAATSALEAGDPHRAATLIEQMVPVWQQREEWATLEAWLQRLPPDVVATSPGLTLGKCRLLKLRCEFGALESELRRLEAMLAEPRTPPMDPTALDAVRGQINASFAYVLHETGGDDWEALGRTHLAFQQIPSDRTDQRGTACLLHAITLQCLGRTDEALAWLHALLWKETALHPTIIARLLNAQAYVEFSSGQLDAATHSARQLVALASAGEFPLHLAWGHYTLGRIAYEWNDLDGATEHFNAVRALGDGAHRLCTVNATCGLALTLAARGNHREAERLVSRELERAEEDGITHLVVRLRSFMARLTLASSDPDQAAHWSAGVDFTQRAITAFDLEDPRLTRALVLLADPTAERLEEASGVLERALDAATSRHIVSSTVKGLAIRALVERSRGEMSTAFKSLSDALTLAAPGRFVRTFVDLGPAFTRLLVELASNGGMPREADRVLEACRAEVGLGTASLPNRNTTRSDDIVSLTWRELDVLHLLDGRHTNREIAQLLSIAEETVKKHAVNIYSKLHVTGRREAVARAYALGLLKERDLRPPTLA